MWVVDKSLEPDDIYPVFLKELERKIVKSWLKLCFTLVIFYGAQELSDFSLGPPSIGILPRRPQEVHFGYLTSSFHIIYDKVMCRVFLKGAYR